MTARPKLSRNLGLLLAVVAAASSLGMVLELAGVVEPRSTPVVSAVTMIEFGVLAYLYLNSAVRLRRNGLVPTEPTFNPKRARLS